MLLLILILIFLTVSLLSFLFLHSKKYFSRDHSKLSSLNEKHQLKYSLQPSIDIITKTLPHQLHLSNIRRSSPPIPNNSIRSHSLANNIYVSSRRRNSIIDSRQISRVQFSLPPTAEQYRRRSVSICTNLIETKPTTIESILKTMKSSNQSLPTLLSFSLILEEGSQIRIDFHSLTSVPTSIQQLTIKVKLIPDGKAKCLDIGNLTSNQKIFDSENDEDSLAFSNIPSTKLSEKAIAMKFYAKDSTKKSYQFGQIGKIYFNQLKDFQVDNRINLVHEIEMMKTSSIEILLSLQRNNDQNLLVDIQRVKGLKINQKNTKSTCFFRVILLDRHRPLATHQTKSYRLNSSTIILKDPLNINILAFNGKNLDRMMILISFYSNAADPNEYRCLARMKLASSNYCSGTGTIHWQQFQARQSFSMWHTLIKD